MTTISGTVTGVTLLGGNTAGVADNSTKVFLLTADFAQYSGGADDANIVSVDTAIESAQRNGRTFTVRGAMRGGPGLTAAGVEVYTSASITNTSGTLSFNLETIGGTEGTFAACEGVQVIVVGDEA